MYGQIPNELGSFDFKPTFGYPITCIDCRGELRFTLSKIGTLTLTHDEIDLIQSVVKHTCKSSNSTAIVSPLPVTKSLEDCLGILRDKDDVLLSIRSDLDDQCELVRRLKLERIRLLKTIGEFDRNIIRLNDGQELYRVKLLCTKIGLVIMIIILFLMMLINVNL